MCPQRDLFTRAAHVAFIWFYALCYLLPAFPFPALVCDYTNFAADTLRVKLAAFEAHVHSHAHAPASIAQLLTDPVLIGALAVTTLFCMHVHASANPARPQPA